MWWTLARPAEEWTEFKLDNALWAIPAARMKARREHVIPLPFQAVKMLRTLLGLTGHRQHLFPGRDNPLGPMTSHSLRQLLKILGWGGIYNPNFVFSKITDPALKQDKSFQNDPFLKTIGVRADSISYQDLKNAPSPAAQIRIQKQREKAKKEQR